MNTKNNGVNPAKYKVIIAVPDEYERRRKSARSTIDSRPRARKVRSQTTKEVSSATDTGTSHHRQEPHSRFWTNGINNTTTPRPSNTTPTRSRSWRLRGVSALRRGSSFHASGIATNPIGTFTKKTARQPSVSPKIWISRPPSSGPTAVDTPTTVPNAPNALPRSRPEKTSWIVALICGVTLPPARPCTSRASTREMPLGANPHTALARVNRASALTNTTRRPCRSPIRPAGTRSRPNVSA